MISIIMPALNEEKNIVVAINNTLAAFDDFGIEGEVIVVNDGSTDNTYELVKQKIEKEQRISMILHDSPKGIGASFWDGVDNAKGDIISMFPGDNENDPWEILRYFNLLEHVDIVIPFVYNKEVRSLFRNVLSSIYRLIINTTFITNLNYTNGTVLYRKSTLTELDHRSHGFFFQTDILIRMVKKGYLFAEVPYRLGLRKTGKSKLLSFPYLWQVTTDYLRLVKDIYWKQRKELNKKGFCPDSLTASRYDLNTKYKEV